MDIKKNASISGVALLTVIIFLIIIASLATTSLFIMSGSVRLSTHQVQRTKAYYVAEAGIVYNLDRLRQGLGIQQYPPPITLDGKTYQANVTLVGATLKSAVSY